MTPDTPNHFDAPEHLSDIAREKYHELAPMLAHYGLLTFADLDTLAVYCQTWARYVEAEERIKTEGATTTAKSGYQQVSPWVTIAKNCRADLMRLGDRLGLNPSGRSRLTASPVEESDHLLA